LEVLGDDALVFGGRTPIFWSPRGTASSCTFVVTLGWQAMDITQTARDTAAALSVSAEFFSSQFASSRFANAPALVPFRSHRVSP
jgi:hypothetical protein